MREHEIRTPHHNLLFCKVVINDDNKLVIETKNGKRVEQFPVEAFLAEINSFTNGVMPELHIATR